MQTSLPEHPTLQRRRQVAAPQAAMDGSHDHADMSPNAAALEKADAEKARNFSHPRQTRTSFLRAQLSGHHPALEGPVLPKFTAFADLAPGSTAVEFRDSGSRYPPKRVYPPVQNGTHRSFGGIAPTLPKSNASTGGAGAVVRRPLFLQSSHLSPRGRFVTTDSLRGSPCAALARVASANSQTGSSSSGDTLGSGLAPMDSATPRANVSDSVQGSPGAPFARFASANQQATSPDSTRKTLNQGSALIRMNSAALRAGRHVSDSTLRKGCGVDELKTPSNQRSGILGLGELIRTSMNVDDEQDEGGQHHIDVAEAVQRLDFPSGEDGGSAHHVRPKGRPISASGKLEHGTGKLEFDPKERALKAQSADGKLMLDFLPEPARAHSPISPSTDGATGDQDPAAWRIKSSRSRPPGDSSPRPAGVGGWARAGREPTLGLHVPAPPRPRETAPTAVLRDATDGRGTSPPLSASDKGTIVDFHDQSPVPGRYGANAGKDHSDNSHDDDDEALLPNLEARSKTGELSALDDDRRDEGAYLQEKLRSNHVFGAGNNGANLARLTPTRLPYPPGFMRSNQYPPRSSSRNATHDFITPPRRSEKLDVPRFVDPRLSREFRESPRSPDLPSAASAKPTELETETARRESQVSKQSSQGSTAKKIMSMGNLRGLFRKGQRERKPDVPASSTIPPTPQAKASLGEPGPPSTLDVRKGKATPPGKRRVTPTRSALPVASSSRSPRTPTSGATPASSPLSNVASSSRVGETTTLAMQLIDAARREPQGLKRDRLFEMSKVMVNAITQARDAEKAMEQAKLAASKAEMASVMTNQTVLELASLIQRWKEGDEVK